MKPGIVYTRGRQFAVDGKPLFLRGLGVGSWLNLEHFMMGVPGHDGDIRRCLRRVSPDFDVRFTEAFFGDADAAYIRSLGINFIRVPLNHHLFWDDERDAVNPFGMRQLERLASLCEKHSLYFLPDLHTTPGGQNPDWHSECRTGTAQFWAFQSFRRRAVKLWEAIAARLHSCPALLGYDILNEPVLPPGGAGRLNEFYHDAIAAIRKWDGEHIVFLEGDRFSMDFSAIVPPADHNWAYAYHYYPGVWDEKLVDPTMDRAKRRAAFAASLDEILTSMGDYQGPYLCGEMGYELCRLEEAFGIGLTEDTVQALEARGSGWCLWCYKDARFMGLAYPRENSAWMRLAQTVRRQWNHPRASQIGQEGVSAIEALCPYDFTEDERYRLQFVVRAALAHTDAAHILRDALEGMSNEDHQALAESFAVTYCEQNAALESLLRTVCAANRAGE